ncbi:MAG: Cytochrome c-552 [Flavobacteriaceae bacterium]|jgi:mono/diheme cytochrome c family protein|nr:MAG: Cytochrome c-552 [Flavobacteriaceae bacterium]|tara:strand:+ start:1235 stop:1636 length:402 start_codon:yes stop_codon:yes gene_type:complete
MKVIGLTSMALYISLIVGLYQQKPLDQSIEEGTLIYQDFCLQCHGSEGKGESGVFPPLAQSDYLMENITQSIQGIKYGMRGVMVVNGVVYEGMMAAQGLDDEEIADVMNYILNSWGNSTQEQITEEQVRSVGP